MRLGIDFGTTRTVVAVADRGNYPVVSFRTETEDYQQWYPVLAAVCGGEWTYALDASRFQFEAGWVVIRSFKRLLADLAPESIIRLAGNEITAVDLLTGYLSQLHRDLCDRSNLEIPAGDRLEVLISTPANANSNQRFLTLEGFRRAGFHVLGMVNEPSAAGIEYAHRYATTDGAAKKEHLVVYDLGGGTFDVSIIGMKERQHEVITDEGISRLGGDDFDELLLAMALDRAESAGPLSEVNRYVLLEECRSRKESLHPNTRKIIIELSRCLNGAGDVLVTTDEYYRHCKPFVEQTIDALETAMNRAFKESSACWLDVAAIYVVGGASDLPIVLRMLRERYGRRVRRSPYPYASTAIGLAIAADTASGFALRERFTRYFGVWREAESGRRISFDTIFKKDTPMPGPLDEPLVYTRNYHPVHNVGHFRYLECSHLSRDGQPEGDITPWDEILFAMDPALQEEPGLGGISVCRKEELESQQIEERYFCASNGVILVTIANKSSGYARTYRLRESSSGDRIQRMGLSRKRTIARTAE